MNIPLHSCTTNKSMADNEKDNGHFRLYTYPDSPVIKKLDPERFMKLFISSTNDFNGKIYAKALDVPNRLKEKRVLKVGGIAGLKAYLDILKEIHGDSHLYLDSGSFFNSEQKNQDQILFLLDYLNPEIVALGSQEFNVDIGRAHYPTFLAKTFKDSKFPILTGNLFDLTIAKSAQLGRVKENHLETINGLKVGFISILDTLTSQKSPSENFTGLYIQNPAKNILSEASTLRRKGADVIILTMNASIDCSSMIAHEEGIPVEKVNFNPKRNNQCNTYENSLYETLKQLPPQTVDMVITSGTQTKVANFIAGYPVMQNFGDGEYLSMAEIYFDKKHGKVVHDETKIYQPVMICHSFLTETNDCYYKESIENENLTEAQFFGKKIKIKELPKN